MGCCDSREPPQAGRNTEIEPLPDAPTETVQVSSGFGTWLASTPPEPSELEGEQFGITIELSGCPAYHLAISGTQPTHQGGPVFHRVVRRIRATERVIRLLTRLYEEQPSQFPPPCATDLIFNGKLLPPSSCFQEASVQKGALCVLQSEPWIIVMVASGPGHVPAPVRVWPEEPMTEMLARVLRQLLGSDSQALERISILLDAEWVAKSNWAGSQEFSLNSLLSVDNQTVKQAAFGSGTTLRPLSDKPRPDLQRFEL